MFTRARIKLTAWYLLIIMTVSLSFSGFIYRGVTLEFKNRLGVIEERLRRDNRGFLPRGPKAAFLEDFEEAQAMVMMSLFHANMVILVFAGLAGYFLAGKTLRPIEEAMEEQKRFTADVSHELRTPLTALKTSMEVSLRNKKLSVKEAREVIEENLEEVDSLKTLTDNLLSLSRFESNGSNFVFERVDVKKLVNKVAKTLMPLANDKKIDVKLELDEVKIDADRNNLEKLMQVLIDNAIKYTKKNGKVEVVLLGEKKFAKIKVKDNGIGIAKNEVVHIFDRFYRVDTSRSKLNVAGFGLGLSMAKKIVEIHKGSIRVESNVGKGTTFVVKLPLKQG